MAFTLQYLSCVNQAFSRSVRDWRLVTWARGALGQGRIGPGLKVKSCLGLGLSDARHIHHDEPLEFGAGVPGMRSVAML